jgi:predicted amidohydrolase
VYVYDKVHTCDWSAEEALTTPGRQWHTGVLATRGGNVTVGSMICADREFPESARTLALNGAELILTPNACGLVDSQLNQFRTRAVENVLGVAMTNYAQSQSCCNGRSVAYGHTGAALAGPATSEAQLLLAKFDVTAIRQARTSAAGQAMLRPLKTLAERSKLCELHRRPEFMRSNVYGRVAGSVV